MLDQLRLHIRLERGARNIALITTLVVTLAAVIVSVMLFIRANNQDFANHQRQTLVGCEIQITLTAYNNSPIMMTPDQALYLDKLRENGCKIESYRQFYRFARMRDGYDILVFRIVPDADMPEYGIKISLTASERLGLNVGDSYQYGDNSVKLPVLEVKYIPVPEIRMAQLGIIVLPESAASDIQLNRQPLYIEVTAPPSGREHIIDEVKAMFPNLQHWPDQPIRTFARDANNLLDDHIVVQSTIENVLLALSITAVFLSIGGIVSVMKLRTEQRKQGYTMLRVNGMTRQDANRFALIESAAIVIVGCFIGILIGFNLYKSISLRMTGLPPIFGVMNLAFWMVAIKTAILLFIVLSYCSCSANKVLFSNNIMWARQQRREQTVRSFSQLLIMFARTIGIILLFTLVLTVLMVNFESINSIITLLLTNLLIVIAVSMLFLIIYAIFNLCVRIIGQIHPRLTGVITMSARLVMKRRYDSALIGTALCTGLAMLLIFYNVSSGMDLYFKRIWEYEMKYGASVEAVTGGDASKILDDNGFIYDTIYRKTFVAIDPPHSNASSVYQVAAIHKGANSGVELSVEKGTYLATFHFLFINRTELGESFTFFDDLNLTCTGDISNMNTTGTISSVTYSAIMDYSDAAPYIDDTWTKAYLIQPNNEQTARLIELGNEHGWYVTTPSRHADSIRTLYANYLSLIYMVCILLSIVVMVFVFSLTMASAMTRFREFSTYRVFGASSKTVGAIVVLENSFIAIIAAILTTAQVLGIFKLIGMALTSLGGVSYTMPIWVMLTVVMVAVGFSILITLAVVATNKMGRTVDMLREE